MNKGIEINRKIEFNNKLIEDRSKIIKHLSELYKEANNSKNYEYEIKKVYKQKFVCRSDMCSIHRQNL